MLITALALLIFIPNFSENGIQNRNGSIMEERRPGKSRQGLEIKLNVAQSERRCSPSVCSIPHASHLKYWNVLLRRAWTPVQNALVCG